MPQPRRRGVVVGRAQVGQQTAGFGVGRRGSPVVHHERRINDPRPGYVAFNCSELDLYFACQLNTQGGQPQSGGPRYDESAILLRTAVAEYTGHDLMRMSVSILLDGYPDFSIVDSIGLFDDLAAYRQDLRRPPRFDIKGDVPYRFNWEWVMDGYAEWDSDPEPIRNREGDLVRQPLTINLLQVEPNVVLRNSVMRSRKSGSGKRKKGPYTVKAGQNDFGDVAKAVFDDRNRGPEIARLNGLPVFHKLKRGQKLRIP